MSKKSELEQLVSEIKKNVNQLAVNKVDEINVMRTMLNDPDFYIGVYDRNAGYVGQRNPHQEAVSFVKGVIQGATGLDGKDARFLAEKYEFTKKDSIFMLTNMKDFLNVYTSTGRKINLIQNAETDASVYIKDIPAGIKKVPCANGIREATTQPYKKLAVDAHCPRYKEKEEINL